MSAPLHPAASPAEILAFVQRLAYSLLGDEHLADEVAQDVWVSALRTHGAEGRRRLGLGWFARAARHLAINRRVADRRRADREERAARPERIDGVEVSERIERQTLVLDAVQRLPEALRTVVYLRYFEELGPSEIATRIDANPATVKSRLVRARNRLREELRRVAGGDETGWLKAIVPTLALSPDRAALTGGAGAAGTLFGTLAMSTLVKVGAAAAVVVIGTVVVLRSPERAPLVPAGAPALAPAEVAASAQPLDGPDRPHENDTRRALEAPTDRAGANAAPATAPASAPVSMRLPGLVIDAEARPLEGVELALVTKVRTPAPEGAPTVRSGAGGTFELVCEPRAGRIVAEDEALVTLFAAQVGPGTSRDAVVIAAPRTAFAGEVVDESGRPLAGVEVRLVLPDGFRRRIPFVTDNCFQVPLVARSDEEGRFALPDGALVTGAFLQSSLAGYVTRRDPLASVGADARLVLRRPGPADEAVRGLVLDPEGYPVEGARVSFGAEVARTDEAGSFQLPRGSTDRAYVRFREGREAESRTLCAVARGYLPACLEVELDGASGEPLWPDGIVLQLAGEPLEIAGRVVDPEGEPLPGTRVFLEEATLFTMAEGSTSIENLLGGDPGDRFTMFEADEDGEFLIGGLQERDYALVAFDWQSGIQTHTEPIAAGGPPVEIVLDPGRAWRRITGRVVSPHGQPLRGCRGPRLHRRDGLRARGPLRAHLEPARRGHRDRRRGALLAAARTEGARLPDADGGRDRRHQRRHRRAPGRSRAGRDRARAGRRAARPRAGHAGEPGRGGRDRAPRPGRPAAGHARPPGQARRAADADAVPRRAHRRPGGRRGGADPGPVQGRRGRPAAAGDPALRGPERALIRLRLARVGGVEVHGARR